MSDANFCEILAWTLCENDPDLKAHGPNVLFRGLNILEIYEAKNYYAALAGVSPLNPIPLVVDDPNWDVVAQLTQLTTDLKPQFAVIDEVIKIITLEGAEVTNKYNGADFKFSEFTKGSISALEHGRYLLERDGDTVSFDSADVDFFTDWLLQAI